MNAVPTTPARASQLILSWNAAIVAALPPRKVSAVARPPQRLVTSDETR